MDIRSLTRGEDALLAQAESLFDEPTQPTAARRFLETDGHHLLVAVLDGEVVGFVSGVEMTHPDKGTEMFLYELGVDDAHRRHGIGTALTQALRDLAQARGCYGMWVLTAQENVDARSTYKHAGADDGEPAVVLNWRF